MAADRLMKRFPTIARMLLACHRDAIGKANAEWLSRHLEHNDWDPRDRVRVREMMPIAAVWLLRVEEDE